VGDRQGDSALVLNADARGDIAKIDRTQREYSSATEIDTLMLESRTRRISLTVARFEKGRQKRCKSAPAPTLAALVWF
jgi:hypothetical protein